jgi:hypothetical protein
MTRSLIFSVAALLLLSGCVGTDLSKLVPNSVAQLQTALQTTADRETTLISELQLENDTLDFMSRGTYGCGDPQDPQQRAFLNAKDPAQYVKQQKVDAAWQKSLVFLAAYLKTLNSAVDANKQEQADIASLTSIASDVAANVPGFPPGTATAAAAFQKVVSAGVLYFNALQMQEAARKMEAPLQAAVANVTKLYPVFTGNEHVAFVKWDSCAREKLRFIRDNPMRRIPGYDPLFAADAGTRLDDAYVAYIAKRNQLRGTPPIADLLKSIVAENRKLADPTKTLSLADVATAGQNAATFLNDLQAAVKAGQTLGGAPATAGGKSGV